MNSKNIRAHLKRKMNDWINSIDDPEVRKMIQQHALVTGGAIASLLTGEPVHDYDVYFTTGEAAYKVAQYYADKWNALQEAQPVTDQKAKVEVLRDEQTGKIDCFIRSDGATGEDWDIYEPEAMSEEGSLTEGEKKEAEAKQTKSKKGLYLPTFFTSNAISLTDKIQIVIRFYGPVEEIHKNFDFAHCTCSWEYSTNRLELPNKALECLLNKELVYMGSRYPLCSIIRTRKYLQRGYHINAGQYVKMAMQLNSLDLCNVAVLQDQLTGVDFTYFQMMIELLKQHMEDTGADTIDATYVIQLIDRLF